ncbi:MAG: hypothetical protein IPJ88_01750 [Myxococcales bacterium]|nr:MAG: hypothetical protein IPJ88_01750 [Myxococcales bacterium]
MSYFLPYFFIVLSVLATGAVVYALFQSLLVLFSTRRDAASHVANLSEDRAGLLAEKQALLTGLKDLEFENEVGKISEADFAELNAQYRERAKVVLEALDKDIGPYKEKAEKLIERSLKHSIILLAALGSLIAFAQDAQAQSDSPQDALNAHLRMQQTLQSHAQADETLPAGTIAVSVMDAEGLAMPGKTVILGVMAQGGARVHQTCQSDEKGQCQFKELTSGELAAYRVKSVHQGVSFATDPFRLPTDQGYRARLVLLSVSTDERPLLQHGQFILDLQDERLHVVQHAQLSNFGTEAYAFPQEGKLVRLPEGFVNFQSQELMTDQRMVEEDNVGFRVFGSLLPGAVTLSWGYHLPVKGGDMTIELPVTWNTFRYQIVIPAIAGIQMSVEGLPETTSFEHDGRTLLGTEMRRRPQDPPVKSLIVHVRGIPGPGPMRWVALFLAALLALSLSVLFWRAGQGAKTKNDLSDRKQALLDEIAMLEKEFKDSTIGPNYFARQKERAVIELAQLLQAEESANKKHAHSSSAATA